MSVIDDILSLPAPLKRSKGSSGSKPAQDAAFLRQINVLSDPTNPIYVQPHKGCVGISCRKSSLLFAFFVEQIDKGIDKVGVARLIRTAKVYPIPGEDSVMVFWRELPWRRDTPEDASDKSS